MTDRSATPDGELTLLCKALEHETLSVQTEFSAQLERLLKEHEAMSVSEPESPMLLPEPSGNGKVPRLLCLSVFAPRTRTRKYIRRVFDQ